MQKPNPGKVTVIFKVTFDETDEIKEGNSINASRTFGTIDQLHVEVEELTIKLFKKLKVKFPAQMKQAKLDQENKRR